MGKNSIDFMKTLTLGKVNNEDLAEWFGVSAKTFSNTKKKRLEELKNYAKFSEVKGKVVIEEVYVDTYLKEAGSNYNKVKNEIENAWSDNGLDTCARVSLEIEDKLKNEISLSSGSFYEYTSKGKRELYGRAWMNDGSIGQCSYVWCKRYGVGVDQYFEPFTLEEEDIKNKLIKKYFGNVTEKQLFVKEMVELGEITKEEAWNVLEELTGMNKKENFIMFKVELEEKLGVPVSKATLIERVDTKMIADNGNE